MCNFTFNNTHLLGFCNFKPSRNTSYTMVSITYRSLPPSELTVSNLDFKRELGRKPEAGDNLKLSFL